MPLILNPPEVSVIKKMFPILSVFILIGMMYVNSPYKMLKEMQTCKMHITELTEVTDYIHLQGTVVERCRRKLYPLGTSRIQSIHVKQGQEVKKGDVLMTLCTENMDATAVFYTEIEEGIRSMDSDLLQRGFFTPKNMEKEKVYDLISPIDGVVMDIKNETGEIVSGVFPCMIVSDLSQLGVSAHISEDNSNQLVSGMDCRIVIASVSDIPFGGYISSIAPYAATASILEPNTGVSVAVEAEITDETKMIRPGSTAELKIAVGPSTQSLIVPYSCVAQDERGEYVLSVDNNSVLKRADVQSGRELQNGIEILEGISINQRIIENPEEYTEGERVRVK